MNLPRMHTAIRESIPLRQNIVDDVAVNIGKSEIAAGVTVGQFLVIQAEQMEHRGV